MILRPQQIALMRMGAPVTPANRSSDNESSSSTSNNYADKRNAVQGGVGVSGDGNYIFNSSTSTDLGSVQAGINAGLAGSMFANQTAQAGIVVSADSANRTVATMADVSKNTNATSSHLADVGLAMLQANTALANSLTNGTNNLATSLFGTVGGLYRDASQQQTNATQIAADLAKTQVAAQNDNRYLIAAGMAVVAIAAVMAFSKGK